MKLTSLAFLAANAGAAFALAWLHDPLWLFNAGAAIGMRAAMLYSRWVRERNGLA